jgi:hypothetical protein
MNSAPRFAFLLGSTVLLLSGCSMHSTPAQAHMAPDPRGDSAKNREDRAQQLIARGAPKDKAVAEASSGWLNFAAADDEKRAAQQKLADDLAKQARAGR